MTGTLNQVAAADDRLHPMPDGTQLWSESAQFTGYDPACGIAVYCHWGLLDRAIWEAVFAVYLPNGEILVSRTFAPRVEGAPDMRTGEATIRPVTPLTEWRTTYDGVARRVAMADLATGPLTDGPTERLRVDVVGVASSPAFGKGMRVDAESMDAHDRNVAVSGSGLHIEQSMRVTGTVEIHGEVVRLDAVGHRDHSCGPRSNSHMWRESWVNATFPDGRTFHLLQVFVTGRPVYFMGYVWDGSGFLDVTDYEGPLLTGALGEPRDFRIAFTCAGRRETVSGELLGALPLTVLPQGMYPGIGDGRDLACEGPARWDWNGQIGYGWVERVFTRDGWPQIRHADAQLRASAP